MKLINNRWVDENSNSWNADLETKKSAQEKSKSLIHCSGCSYCSDCSDCSYCSNCSNCSDYKQNPQRYMTLRIGKRKAQTVMYWTTKEDVQIICGCWIGNLFEFEKRVKEVHSNNKKYLDEYLREIKKFKYLLK